jgi:hypothetical protein
MGFSRVSPLHWCVGWSAVGSFAFPLLELNGPPPLFQTKPSPPECTPPLPLTGHCPGHERDALRDIPLLHEAPNAAR